VQVTAPPPPGRIEVVPRSPSAAGVWVDGEWVWRRGRWAWLPGRWVEASKGASFSPSAFVRGADGRLWYAPGLWRDANGSTLDAPRTLTSAVVGSNEVVNASGSTENTGPTLKHPSTPANHR
jgi:hypothetical protein